MNQKLPKTKSKDTFWLLSNVKMTFSEFLQHNISALCHGEQLSITFYYLLWLVLARLFVCSRHSPLAHALRALKWANANQWNHLSKCWHGHLFVVQCILCVPITQYQTYVQVHLIWMRIILQQSVLHFKTAWISLLSRKTPYMIWMPIQKQQCEQNWKWNQQRKRPHRRAFEQ